MRRRAFRAFTKFEDIKVGDVIRYPKPTSKIVEERHPELFDRSFKVKSIRSGEALDYGQKRGEGWSYLHFSTEDIKSGETINLTGNRFTFVPDKDIMATLPNGEEKECTEMKIIKGYDVIKKDE